MGARTDAPCGQVRACPPRSASFRRIGDRLSDELAPFFLGSRPRRRVNPPDEKFECLAENRNIEVAPRARKLFENGEVGYRGE
jgi:hypothetical protein